MNINLSHFKGFLTLALNLLDNSDNELMAQK
jgi:hypothetical protein